MPRGATHQRTDPACARHRPPLGRVGRWWFDLHRGLACRLCMEWD